MDFITGLPRSTKQNDAFIVVVEKLSKDAHFIPIKSTCKEIDIVIIFMKEIFRLHGMPKEIILEDMLRMHVMHQPKKWEDYLPLVEFAYSNGYQESLKMSHFESLYGRQCNNPISWNNPVDRVTIRPDMLKEMEHQVIQIRQI
jgi:hypothetical protein